MTEPEHDLDAFVDALRADLPTAADDARVRARLAATGLLAAAVALPSSAAGSAAAAGAKLGVWSKLSALPLGAKVGLTAVAVTATATVPIAAPAWLAHEPAAAPIGAKAPGATPRSAAGFTEPHRKDTAAPEATGTPVERPAMEERASARGDRAIDNPREKTTNNGAGAPEHSAKVSSVGETGRAAENPGDAVAVFPKLEQSPESTLHEETMLLERALGALRAGDRDAAFAALAEHARRYPYGLLARERERALDRARELAASEGAPN